MQRLCSSDRSRRHRTRSSRIGHDRDWCRRIRSNGVGCCLGRIVRRCVCHVALLMVKVFVSSVKSSSADEMKQ